MSYVLAVLLISPLLLSARGFPVISSQWWGSPSLQPKLQTAVFALGSFWESEARFGCLEGVFSTRVGYCGGQSETPDYSHPGDHVETVEVTYDPTRISYSELLDVFWSAFGPFPTTIRGAHTGSQYKTTIYVNGAEERKLAVDSKERHESTKSVDSVKVLDVDTFHPAEEEHQKFQLRRRPEIVRCLDWGSRHLTSRFAARVNGYVGGFCTSKKGREIERALRPLMKRLTRLETDVIDLERI